MSPAGGAYWRDYISYPAVRAVVAGNETEVFCRMPLIHPTCNPDLAMRIRSVRQLPDKRPAKLSPARSGRGLSAQRSATAATLSLELRSTRFT